MSPSKYKWAVVTVGIFGSFIAVLDTSMVNVALAHLSQEFNASIDQVQWVVTGNFLALGVVIPSCGYLADSSA